jgi:hypothetical protein
MKMLSGLLAIRNPAAGPCFARLNTTARGRLWPLVAAGGLIGVINNENIRGVACQG